MTIATVTQALARANSIVRNRTDTRDSEGKISSGVCDHEVAVYYGLPSSGFYSAKTHVEQTPAKYKHNGPIPAGALVPFAIGKFWHMTMGAGGTKVFSTDIVESHKVNVVDISVITSHWGAKLLPWMDAFYGSQGIRLVPPVLPPSHPAQHPVLRLANLRMGLKNNDVRQFQAALRRFHGLSALNPSGATGYYGNETVAMCQRAYRILGMTKGDLRVPGPKLLGALGFRAG